MKTDIKTLLEFAGVDTTKGKAKQLVEASFIVAEDLSKKTNKELAASLGSNEMNLHKATDPAKKKILAKKIAHTKDEISSRGKAKELIESTLMENFVDEKDGIVIFDEDHWIGITDVLSHAKFQRMVDTLAQSHPEVQAAFSNVAHLAIDHKESPHRYGGSVKTKMTAKEYLNGLLKFAKENFSDALVEASTIDGKVQDPKKLVWKQTSLSSEEAAKKWGKENVRIGSKKSQGGDDIVEVRTKLGPK